MCLFGGEVLCDSLILTSCLNGADQMYCIKIVFFNRALKLYLNKGFNFYGKYDSHPCGFASEKCSKIQNNYRGTVFDYHINYFCIQFLHSVFAIKLISICL